MLCVLLYCSCASVLQQEAEAVVVEKKEEVKKDSDVPDSNIIRVSRKLPVTFYARRLRKMLQTFDKVILQGLGKAIMSTVELSQFVVHNMDCKITKIRTQTTNDRLKKKKIMIEIMSNAPPAATAETPAAPASVE
eukprot:CAMPEP_0197540716 /NCGR_PEP_ID=MMETSP1318-20131121/66752_1 /TAXON_ID=552666 /ORGANISM="Partenskyella glossopodia, Strain RCC365" /LENGTH=134 /DNA_ID=CAMNT_0043099801 /DNA_START=103 /DNA_END=507 /DNA_ORIENTATION=+